MTVEIVTIPTVDVVGKVTCDHGKCDGHAKYSLSLLRDDSVEFVMVGNYCSNHILRATQLTVGVGK